MEEEDINLFSSRYLFWKDLVCGSSVTAEKKCLTASFSHRNKHKQPDIAPVVRAVLEREKKASSNNLLSNITPMVTCNIFAG